MSSGQSNTIPLAVAVGLLILVSCSPSATPTSVPSPTSTPSVPVVVARVSTSLVRVLAIAERGGSQVPVVLGSGFVVGANGVIATAAHVIDQIPADLFVVPADIDSFTPEGARAEVLHVDREHDLALLRAPIVKSRKPLEIEPSAGAAVGEDVLILGFPLGDPVLTVSRGIIAARTSRVLQDGATPSELIRLDLSLNKGNSGGPVLRVSTGKVIGVANLKDGAIQDRLKRLLREKQFASIEIGGNDPIELIKLLAQDMDTNLQIGLGLAVPSEHLLNAIRTNQ